MAVDLLQWIRDGRANVKWGHLISKHNGHVLVVPAMRDAMTFDDVPSMRWNRTVINANDKRDGVRMASTAKELQEIADALFCMPFTPKMLDLMWIAAGDYGTRFNSIVNVGGIVATANIHAVHDAVEKALAKAGGDIGGFIAAVGKYWVICNRLLGGKFGKNQAINYGWYHTAAKSRSVLKTTNVFQMIAGAHDHHHFDPSQVIRLLYRMAKLLRAGSRVWEDIDLYEVAVDPELAGLISHEGVLKTTRMLAVPEPQPVTQDDGIILMPETLFLGSMPDDAALLDSLLSTHIA